MMVVGFELSKADPCVFRKMVNGKVETAAVVHMDEFLTHAKD